MLTALLFLQAAAPQFDVDSEISKLREQVERAKLAPTAEDVLDRVMTRLHGKAQQKAFDVFGYPDRKMALGGATVFTWTNNIGDAYAGTLTCTLKIVARRGIIIDSDWAGNHGACQRYAIKAEPTLVPPRW